MVATLNTKLVAGSVSDPPAPVVAIPYRVDSISAQGTLTAPTALAVIATIVSGSLPAGMYQIDCQAVFAGGAPAAAEDLNIALSRQGTIVKRLISPRVLHVPFSASIQLIFSGAQALTVIAVGAATASVVYNVSVTATKIGE